MIAHRIFTLRKSRNLTQAQLAEALHISSSTMGMYEQARRTPDLNTLVALSRFFDVSLDYLITGREFPPTESVCPAGSCPCCPRYRKNCKKPY